MKKNSPPVFQEYAFDPALGVKHFEPTLHVRKYLWEELRFVAPKEDLQDSNRFDYGFQIRRFRTGYKKIPPPWARKNSDIAKLLLAAFPALFTSITQRKRAGKWAQIINLYYKVGWSSGQIAKELNVQRNAVRRMLISMSRVSRGLRANGSGSITSKSRLQYLEGIEL
ncbi:MAG TPA: hypothetical protein VMH89_10525 [Candidatus Acidoferrum sp.]|nr:hypothetical protein [Candidatus Acidoferrum sp.]